MGVSDIIGSQRSLMKQQFVAVVVKKTVCYNEMKMRVEIESLSEMVNEADRTNLRVKNVGTANDKPFSDRINDKKRASRSVYEGVNPL